MSRILKLSKILGMLKQSTVNILMNVKTVKKNGVFKISKHFDNDKTVKKREWWNGQIIKNLYQ